MFIFLPGWLTTLIASDWSKSNPHGTKLPHTYRPPSTQQAVYSRATRGPKTCFWEARASAPQPVCRRKAQSLLLVSAMKDSVIPSAMSSFTHFSSPLSSPFSPRWTMWKSARGSGFGAVSTRVGKRWLIRAHTNASLCMLHQPRH